MDHRNVTKRIPATVQQIIFEEIIFYGTGVSSISTVNIMEHCLRALFKGERISLHHDLLGAVRALCGNEPGIACILGTGSNSALFNGTELIKKSPALGFILGDEGSGAHIGKSLLTDYLYKQVPEPLDNHLSNDLGLDRETIMNKIYKESNPNRYLASFCELLSGFRGLNYVEQLLKDSFTTFMKQHVLIYDASHDLPIHFTGSIAHHFGDVLANLCEEKGLSLGKIVDRPVEELVQYHLNEYHA